MTLMILKTERKRKISLQMGGTVTPVVPIIANRSKSSLHKDNNRVRDASDASRGQVSFLLVFFYILY
jgi:hypothetical protein